MLATVAAAVRVRTCADAYRPTNSAAARAHTRPQRRQAFPTTATDVALKVCAEPGCPNPSSKTRCIDCTRTRDRARGTRQARGYDAQYERQLQDPEYLAATHCSECGGPFTVDNPKTGGHSVAIRHGGKGSKVVPHCRRCNYGWERTDL